MRADQQGTKVDNSTLQLISDLTNKVDTEHAAILAENAQNLEGLVDTSSEGLKQKVQQSIQKLQKGLLERETEVCMQLLCLLMCGFSACHVAASRALSFVACFTISWYMHAQVQSLLVNLHRHVSLRCAALLLSGCNCLVAGATAAAGWSCQ